MRPEAEIATVQQGDSEVTYELFAWYEPLLMTCIDSRMKFGA